MKKHIFVTALSVVLLAAVSCGAGRITGSADKSDKTTVPVSSYHAVCANNGIHVILTDGPQGKITVEAEKKYRDHLKIKVTNGVLSLSLKNIDLVNNKLPHSKVEVFVPVKKVYGIYGNTGAYFTAEDLKSKEPVDVELTTGAVFQGSISAKSLTVTLATGSRFDGIVESEYFSMDQSTGSRSTVSGTAKRASLSLSTGSKSSWSRFKIDSLETDISTGSSATVNAGAISVDVSTAGTLRYIGMPQIRELNVSTGGSLRAIKD